MLTSLKRVIQEQAVRETEAVFGPLRERIGTAREKLEGLLVRLPVVFFFFFSCPFSAVGLCFSFESICLVRVSYTAVWELADRGPG